MKPLRVHPLKTSYDPGYPRFVEIAEWEQLLAVSNRSIFHPSTLLFAGILGSALLVEAGAAEGENVGGPPLKAANPRAAEIANAALEKVKESGFWFKSSKDGELRPVKGNPPIVAPQIRVSFGNSYVGIFDAVRAKKVTIELFAAYGVKLLADYPFKKSGIEFLADGYDPERKIGFEIIGADNPDRGFSRVEPKQEKDPAKALDEKEAKQLEESVADGKETMFLAPASAYPNMDGDQYTPLRAYLRSVIDYLDWLKKNGRL